MVDCLAMMQQAPTNLTSVPAALTAALAASGVVKMEVDGHHLHHPHHHHHPHQHLQQHHNDDTSSSHGSCDGDMVESPSSSGGIEHKWNGSSSVLPRGDGSHFHSGPMSSTSSDGSPSAPSNADASATALCPGEAGTDAEGVWSPDIEQAFQEGMILYPPCGRRKIILQDEGKMYGRNELIARYIKIRTNKTRTRKQVSSHIQVLARKKSREISAKLKVQPSVDQLTKEKQLNSLNSMSSAQIVSYSNMSNKLTAAALAQAQLREFYSATSLWPPTPAMSVGDIAETASSSDTKPLFINPGLAAIVQSSASNSIQAHLGMSPLDATRQNIIKLITAGAPAWDFVLTGNKVKMCKFCAYVESKQSGGRKHELVYLNPTPYLHLSSMETIDISEISDKFPEKGGLKELFQRGPAGAFYLVKFWTNVAFQLPDEASAIYAVDSRYESTENVTISVSTKACSFGQQVVEKVEVEGGCYDHESNKYVFRFDRSPMCDYMVNFILKLKKLNDKHTQNTVLDNFTVLQVVSDKNTQETLLCVAFVFEVSDGSDSQHHVYRLVSNNNGVGSIAAPRRM